MNLLMHKQPQQQIGTETSLAYLTKGILVRKSYLGLVSSLEGQSS